MLEGLSSIITDMLYLCFSNVSIETNLFQLCFLVIFTIGIIRFTISLFKYKY